MKTYDARIIHSRYLKSRRKAFIADIIISELVAYGIHMGVFLAKGKGVLGALEAIQNGYALLPISLLLFIYICSDLICCGCSIGKRMFNLKIVDRTTGSVPKVQILIVRNLPIILLPFELVFQVFLGESLGDHLTRTIVLPVDEQTKRGEVPKWMEAVDGLSLTRLKRIGAVAFVLLLLVASAISMFRVTKTDEYAAAREYLVATAVDSEDDPMIILTSYHSTTVTYEGYRERTVTFQFLVDGKVKNVVCKQTDVGWDIADS